MKLAVSLLLKEFCIIFTDVADLQLIVPHLQWILTFIDIVGNEQEKSDSVIACASGLLG